MQPHTDTLIKMMTCDSSYKVTDTCLLPLQFLSRPNVWLDMFSYATTQTHMWAPRHQPAAPEPAHVLRCQFQVCPDPPPSALSAVGNRGMFHHLEKLKDDRGGLVGAREARRVALFLVRVRWAQRGLSVCLPPCGDGSRTELSPCRDGITQATTLSFKARAAVAATEEQDPRIIHSTGRAAPSLAATHHGAWGRSLPTSQA